MIATNFNNHNIITLIQSRIGVSLGMEKASRMLITSPNQSTGYKMDTSFLEKGKRGYSGFSYSTVRGKCLG